MGETSHEAQGPIDAVTKLRRSKCERKKARKLRIHEVIKELEM